MDAYKMLNLRDLKRRGNVITDEIVQKNYLAIRESYLKMREKESKAKSDNESTRTESEKSEETLSKINSEEINVMVRR